MSGSLAPSAYLCDRFGTTERCENAAKVERARQGLIDAGVDAVVDGVADIMISEQDSTYEGHMLELDGEEALSQADNMEALIERGFPQKFRCPSCPLRKACELRE